MRTGTAAVTARVGIGAVGAVTICFDGMLVDGWGLRLLEGRDDGARDGTRDGTLEGILEGDLVGDGTRDGTRDGARDGTLEGAPEGDLVGDGTRDGTWDGARDGACDDTQEGTWDGDDKVLALGLKFAAMSAFVTMIFARLFFMEHHPEMKTLLET